jgi:hypothetical protein
MGFPPFGFPPRPHMPPGMGMAAPSAGRGVQPPPVSGAATTSAPQKPPVTGPISLPPPPAGAPAQPAAPKVEKKTSLYVGKIPEGTCLCNAARGCCGAASPHGYFAFAIPACVTLCAAA